MIITRDIAEQRNYASYGDLNGGSWEVELAPPVSVTVTLDCIGKPSEYGEIFGLLTPTTTGYYYIENKRNMMELSAMGLVCSDWELPLIPIESKHGNRLETLLECADNLRDLLIGPMYITSIDHRREGYRILAKIVLKGARTPR